MHTTKNNCPRDTGEMKKVSRNKCKFCFFCASFPFLIFFACLLPYIFVVFNAFSRAKVLGLHFLGAFFCWHVLHFNQVLQSIG